MTFARHLFKLAAFTTAVGITSPTFSDEAALYEEAAPADAVFVRLLQGHQAPMATIPLGGVELSFNDIQKDTYVAISAENLAGVTAGAFYSFVANETGQFLIEEPARETSAKVHLILLNTSDAPVRLVVPQRDIQVVAAINAGEAASRAVNPIETELAVERVSDGFVLGTFNVSLARGQNLTFVANHNGARLIENNFGPVLTLN